MRSTYIFPQRDYADRSTHRTVDAVSYSQSVFRSPMRRMFLGMAQRCNGELLALAMVVLLP